MAETPAMPFWTDAYLGDTTHLTCLEHGAYMLLLITMWRAGGSLPNDDKRLARFARLTPAQWARIKPTLMDFFQQENDSITQGRLNDELNFVRRQRKRQSNNARAKYRKYNGAPTATGQPNSASGSAPTPTPNKDSPLSSPQGDKDQVRRKKTDGKPAHYSEEFEAFMAAYPRRVGKGEAWEVWQRLPPKVRADIVVIGAPAYARLVHSENRQQKHIKTPAAWLNQRGFDDFIEWETGDWDWNGKIENGRDGGHPAGVRADHSKHGGVDGVGETQGKPRRADGIHGPTRQGDGSDEHVLGEEQMAAGSSEVRGAMAEWRSPALSACLGLEDPIDACQTTRPSGSRAPSLGGRSATRH